MPRLGRVTAAVALAATLAGCRIDVAEVTAAPDGYHRMADGTLMADVVMETEYRDLAGNGVLVATHTRPDGTVVLGSPPDHANGDHGGHSSHAVPDPADFPQGIEPVRLVVPRLELDAPVVPAAMTAASIEGPPVAGDVAWLEQTRRPGEIGPAVIGGVAELDGEPGAYADLGTLAPGDEFVVFGTEQEALAFRVVGVEEQPVGERAEVFRGGASVPQVRLVSWAGPGDDTDLIVHAEVIDPDA